MKSELSVKSEQLIDELLHDGSYASRAEVLEDALELLRQRRELLRHIDAGTEQLRTGQYNDYDEQSLHELFGQIKAEGRQRLTVTEDRA